MVSASILLGIALTVLILRSILSPLRSLISAVRQIGSGNVTAAPAMPMHGELGEMAGALRLLRDGLEARARLEQETEHQRQVIRHAIESINEGFSLCDSEQRLILCNSYYRALHSGVADLLAEGVSFRKLLHAALDRGVIAPAGPAAEAWIARWLLEDGPVAISGAFEVAMPRSNAGSASGGYASANVRPTTAAPLRSTPTSPS